MMNAVSYFFKMDSHPSGSSAASVFQKFGEKSSHLLLLDFPTTYVAEQGFSEVLHTRNKYRNRLHMKKTREMPYDS